MYKCELLISGYSYDVTNNVVNWDDIKASLKRDSYDGVVISFSTKFDFSDGAYSLLKTEYDAKYLSSSAIVIISTRNNSWTWNERFRCSLDFSTYENTGYHININAIDDSTASKVKANKSTVYEYEVEGLKDDSQLYYDRLMMNNTAEWIITGNNVEEEGGMYVENTFVGDNSTHTIPLYLKSSEIATKNIVEIRDVANEEVSINSYNKNNFFFENTSNDDIVVNISMKFYLWALRLPNTTSTYLQLVHFYKNTGGTGVADQMLYDGNNIIDFSVKNYKIKSKWSLQLRLSIKGEGVTLYQIMPFASNEILKIDFQARDVPVNIDVIKPINLLNSILKSINGGKDGLIGEILNGDVRLDKTVIVPAESIRGIQGAKVHTSYQKFTEWMSAEFGYVPVISENKISFVHRNTLFKDKEIKHLEEVRDFSYSVNQSLVYSSVKVGYDKQDYDSVNGRDEFRFTNEFTTGISLTTNTLQLISPYRADAYGVEFLAQKRGEDTTDNKSDNTVFFVNASLVQGRYELVRNISISGVISPETMFNAAYSPRYMLEANKRFIGAGIERLTFASSEGNSDVIISGVSEKDDFVILVSDRLFTIGEASVETNDLDIPEQTDGYISFCYHGQQYKGYIKSVDFNFGKAEAVKYNLTVKSYD